MPELPPVPNLDLNVDPRTATSLPPAAVPPPQPRVDAVSLQRERADTARRSEPTASGGMLTVSRAGDTLSPSAAGSNGANSVPVGAVGHSRDVDSAGLVERSPASKLPAGPAACALRGGSRAASARRRGHPRGDARRFRGDAHRHREERSGSRIHTDRAGYNAPAAASRQPRAQLGAPGAVRHGCCHWCGSNLTLGHRPGLPCSPSKTRANHPQRPREAERRVSSSRRRSPLTPSRPRRQERRRCQTDEPQAASRRSARASRPTALETLPR